VKIHGTQQRRKEIEITEGRDLRFEDLRIWNLRISFEDLDLRILVEDLFEDLRI